MSGPDVRIRTLRLRLRGTDSGAARSFAKRLGSALPERAQAVGPASPNAASVRVRARPGEGSGDIARRIAQALAEGKR